MYINHSKFENQRREGTKMKGLVNMYAIWFLESICTRWISLAWNCPKQDDYLSRCVSSFHETYDWKQYQWRWCCHKILSHATDDWLRSHAWGIIVGELHTMCWIKSCILSTYKTCANVSCTSNLCDLYEEINWSQWMIFWFLNMCPNRSQWIL